MITGTSLKHGGYYHFRIHKGKAELLSSNGLSSLKSYLLNVLKDCPESHFLEGPRSSILKFSVSANLFEEERDVSLLARMGLDSGYYDNAHMNVQMFMLAYDSKTVAIEVPIWLEPSEFSGFEDLFGSDLSLSGHIDILRVEDGRIWVWDYKPNARREKYADTQVYFYALMLSKRSGIPLEKFMCGYFDDKHVFTFNPSKVSLK